MDHDSILSGQTTGKSDTLSFIIRLGEIISFVNMVARAVIEWQFMKRRTTYDSR
jgi:hypothetical protein